MAVVARPPGITGQPLAETKRLDPEITGVAAWAEAPGLLAALGRHELTGRTLLRVS